MPKKKKFDAALVSSILSGEHPASALLDGSGAVASFAEDAVIAAVEAARRQEDSAALVRIRDTASQKSVRKAAAGALHRLKAAGVSVDETRSGSTWTARGGALDTPPSPVALIGLPNPNGYFPFVLIAYGQQEACASAGLAGAGQGHIDADHGHLSRSSAREVIHNTKLQQGLREVPFYAGLHFVQRAFDEGGQGEPHGFGHLLESVPDGVKNAARMIDPLEQETQTLESDALHAIEPLMDPRHGVYLALDEEQAYSAMGRIGEALGGASELDEDSRMQRLRAVIDETADAYLNDGTRRSWSLALDVVTFLASLDNNTPLQRAARHTALALRENMPARDIPFVREWVSAQLQSVTEMFLAQSGTGPDYTLGEEGDEPTSPIITDV